MRRIVSLRAPVPLTSSSTRRSLSGSLAERAARVAPRQRAPARGRPAPYRRAPAAASLRHRSRRCLSRSASRSTMPRTIAARSSGPSARPPRHRRALGPGGGAGAPDRRAPAPARTMIRPTAHPAARRAASSRQIAAASVALAVLLGREAEKEARLRMSSASSASARSNAAFASAVTMPFAAADQRLAEIGLALGASAPLSRSALRRAFTASSKRPSRI